MEKTTKKLKKLIVLLCILISIIVIAIIYVYLYKSKNQIIVDNKDNKDDNIIQVENEIINEQEGIKRVNDNNEYYKVIKGIEKLSKYVRKEKEQEIIDLLDKSYIEEKGIEEDNVDKHIPYMGTYQKFYMYELYKERESNNVIRYYAYGKLAVGYEKEKNIDIWYILRVDDNVSAYSIIPFYENADEIEEFEKNAAKYTKKDIDINFSNAVEYGQASNEFMSKEYFYNFQYRMIYDYNNFYNMIDEKYRNKRFENKDEYIEYLKENYDTIMNMTIQEYQVEENLDYNEYVCLNNKNTYYTIKVKNVMEYTVVLDDYTLKTDKFKEVYSNSSEEEKVYTDIEIFLKMLNNKDYKAAYACLDESFRQKNFDTLDVFKEYVKKEFFDYTIIENIESVKKVASYYVCKIDVASGINLASNKGEKSFIVSFDEDDNFVLSFEVE